MKCPHCSKPLTEAEVKAIWGSYTSSKRKTRGAGRKGGRRKKPSPSNTQPLDHPHP